MNSSAAMFRANLQDLVGARSGQYTTDVDLIAATVKKFESIPTSVLKQMFDKFHSRDNYDLPNYHDPLDMDTYYCRHGLGHLVAYRYRMEKQREERER